MIHDIAQAVALVLTWQAVLWITLGYSFGSLLGAIPGLTGIVGIALLLPLSYYLPPWVAIPMLMAISKGSSFGCNIPAILINTPGTPAAAATCLDGHQLALQGRSGKALKANLYAGLIGDTFSDIVLIFSAGLLARVALKFGPAEYASLMVFALTVVGAVSTGAVIKGVMGAALGVLLGVVGMDMITGVSRLTFGVIELGDGIAMIPLMIGLLALSEIFLHAEKLLASRDADQGRVATVPPPRHPDDSRITRDEVPRFARATAIGALIGTVVGALPGIGQSVAAFVGYGEARRFSPNPEAFGRGSIEGVAAPEAAASAVNGANLIPLLALGIPGDVVAAVLLGALMIQGLAPGPLLFEQHRVTVFALYAGMMITNLIHWPVGLVFIRASNLVSRIRLAHMMPVVFILCVAGTFALGNSVFDVYVMIIAGVGGAVLRKGGFAPVTVVIGFILGPLLENSARQALLLSQGSFLTFITRPISLFFLVLTAASIVGSFLYARQRGSAAIPGATTSE
ncbi:MAG: tripartite tricarboxylate transporter permease [Proteobacteria bacterium]|nr:tripartite tricarboxylate transporter permease [Pseudomonadota bacterium]